MEKEKNQRTGNGQRRTYGAILLCFLFTALCVVFSVLCLRNTQNPFIQKYNPWLVAISCLTLIGVYSVCVYFLFAKKVSPFRACISGYVLLSFILIFVFVLQKTGFFYVVKDAERFQAYLKESGAWMPVFYILLQYLQVVLLPIPGFVSTAAGVALFGPFYTFLYSFIGVTLGSLTAFYIGRKFGNKAVAWMIGEDVLKKWMKKVKGKDNFILTAMFFLPIFPDDVLCFIAGLSSMTTKYFVWMIIVSRLLAILTTCYSVNFIPFNTWWGISVWIGLILFIVVLFIALYKNLDKIQGKFERIFTAKSKKKKN